MIAAAGLILLSAAAYRAARFAQAQETGMLVYIGTYTGHGSQGIYAYRFDAGTGALQPLGLAAETKDPAFLAVHPNGRFLYAVNETDHGTVSAFSIDSVTGKLTPLNQVSSQGSGPCYISVDHTGRAAFVANYGSGSFAALRINADGTLGDAMAFYPHEGFPSSGPHADHKRQDKPHAHYIDVSPDNRFVIAVDLGLDKVFIYRFDAALSRILPAAQPFASVAQGAGPRHAAFLPDGKAVYVLNELNSTVTVFAFNDGAMHQIQMISTLPADFKGENYPAEIAVHPSGQFLYVSNRGFDTITLFGIDAEDGKLQPVEQFSTRGKWPRHFAIDPSGTFLLAANEKSGSVSIYRIDEDIGRLRPAGRPFAVPSPACIRFVPSR